MNAVKNGPSESMPVTLSENTLPEGEDAPSCDASCDITGLDMTRGEDIHKVFNMGQKRAEVLRCQEQRLYEKSISELLQMSVNERWQAVIEWAFEPELRHGYIRIDSVYDEATRSFYYQWWKYPFTKGQSSEAQEKALQKYKSQAIGYSSPLLSEQDGPSRNRLKKHNDWIDKTRKKLEAAVKHTSQNRLFEILNEPGNRYDSLSVRILLLQNFLLDEPAFFSDFSDINNLPDPLQPTALPEERDSATILSRSTLTDREQLFICWLEESAKYAEDGWLTLESINQRNNVLSPKKKVFKPRKYKRVDSGNIRQILNQMRKYPAYHDAIETMPQDGKAWRLKDWQQKRG